MPDDPVSILPMPSSGSPAAPVAILAVPGAGGTPAAPVAILASPGAGGAPSAPLAILDVPSSAGAPSAPAAILAAIASTADEIRIQLIGSPSGGAGVMVVTESGPWPVGGTYNTGTTLTVEEDSDPSVWGLDVVGYLQSVFDTETVEITLVGDEIRITPVPADEGFLAGIMIMNGSGTTGITTTFAGIVPGGTPAMPAAILEAAAGAGSPAAPESVLASAADTPANKVTISGSPTDDGSPVVFPDLIYVGEIAANQYAWTSTGTYPRPPTGTWYVCIVLKSSQIALLQKHVDNAFAAAWQNTSIGAGRTDPNGVVFSPATTAYGAGGTATATLVTYPEAPASVLA